jgi:hypothetical protein
MDITPHVNLLRSLRGERIDYVLLIGEGIDNAFDAGASSIVIEISDDEISFQDDGVGITRDRIPSVFSLGDHGSMATTNLGRFGVGIKRQAVNTGNIFSVISISADGKVRCEVNWGQILKSGHWTVDDPRWLPVAIGTQTGTTVAISKLRKPPPVSLEKIASAVALRFYPALADGRRVILNANPVDFLAEPNMTDIVDCRLVLSDGRSAHLRGGMLTAPSKLNRVHVAYKHRVIMPGCPLGCGEYGGLTKMFARLQLSGPWHLATFKDDLPDEGEREELEAAVLEALRPILEKCNSASMSARVDEISKLLNEMIPPDLAAARPKRKKKPEPGPPGPKRKKKPGQVDSEQSEPDGPAKTRRPKDRLLITFDGVAEVDGIGTFRPGRPHRIDLSKDDPHVAQLLEHRDHAIGLRSLYALAMTLFEQGRYASQPEPELPFEPFGKRIASLLAMQDLAEVASAR